MKAIGYFTKIAQPKGEYKETTLDAQKKQADALLTSIDGDYYSLALNRPIDVKPGRGIKIYSDTNIAVTESVYKKLASKYNIMTDF